MTPPVYVINRRADEERLAGFAAAADALGLAWSRIPAFDGHDPEAPFFLYRHWTPQSFWGREAIKPGAFACYISHAAAWRRLLSTDAEAALICEDDARLTGDAAALEALAALGADADVVFANDRMAAWRAAAGLDGDAPLTAARVIAAMTEKGAAPGRDGLSRAPGADAYLVTRRGAERLLRMLDRDGVRCGVDWAMLASGLTETPEWEETSALGLAEAPLDIRVAAPIAKLAPGPSVINHAAEVPLASLRDADAVLVGDADGPALRLPEGDERDPVFAAAAEGRLYEAQGLEMARRWMPEGGVFVDVGAHIGLYAAFLLRFGPAGRAIVFEPHPAAIAGLRRTAELNGLGERIDMAHLGLALGAERGKAERRGSRKLPFTARFRRGFVETEPMRPGDAILREETVDMVKIDVNGDEKDALRGLRKTMKRKRPVLMLDLSHKRADRIRPLIARLGYAERETAQWEEHGDPRKLAIFTAEP